MTTTNRIKAGTAYGCTTAGCNYPEGGCMDTCNFRTRRVDASQLDDNRTVMVAGDVDTPRKYADRPMPFQYAEPEPIDWASFRPLVIAGVVICIAILSFWRLS